MIQVTILVHNSCPQFLSEVSSCDHTFFFLTSIFLSPFYLKLYAQDVNSSKNVNFWMLYWFDRWWFPQWVSVIKDPCHILMEIWNLKLWPQGLDSTINSRLYAMLIIGTVVKWRMLHYQRQSKSRKSNLSFLAITKNHLTWLSWPFSNLAMEQDDRSQKMYSNPSFNNLN